MGIELFDLCGAKAHRRESYDVKQRSAFYEIIECRGADVNGRRVNCKIRVAFRWPIEINKDLPLIVRKVAARCRETSRVNFEADPRLSLVNKPALTSRPNVD